MKMLTKNLCLYVALFLLVGCAGITYEYTVGSSENTAVSESTKKETDKTKEGTSSSEFEVSVDSVSDTVTENNDLNIGGNNTDTSWKEEYLKKINNTKKDTENLQTADSSTYALKKVENDRLEAWDKLLNEIYGVLKEQLSPEEMNHLRKEQRNWIEYRDDSALEASLKYKGGTQEQLEYVAVLANLTEERCYELVKEYLK